MKLIDNNITRSICPLCLSSNIQKVGEIVYSKPLHFSSIEISLKKVPEFWKCKRCSSGFVSNLIPKNVLMQLYKDGKSSEKWNYCDFEKDKPLRMVKQLDELLFPGNCVLDIGCNTGNFLDFAKTKGCITHGIEYSVSSLNILENKGHKGFSTENEIKSTYDVITAFDVIEHIYDVNLFLKFFSDKLKNNGYLVFLTGDISCINAVFAGSNWWYIALPEHIVFPSKKYFESQKILKMLKCVSVYQSNYFNFPFVSKSKIILKDIFQYGKYNGFPAIWEDHILVIMQKK